MKLGGLVLEAQDIEVLSRDWLHEYFLTRDVTQNEVCLVKVLPPITWTGAFPLPSDFVWPLLDVFYPCFTLFLVSVPVVGLSLTSWLICFFLCVSSMP
jgi:hypothetical protein